MLSRSLLTRANVNRVFTRGASSIPAVDVEHFTSGWNIDDIENYAKPGFYNVHTFNKISEKVRSIIFISREECVGMN